MTTTEEPMTTPTLSDRQQALADYLAERINVGHVFGDPIGADRATEIVADINDDAYVALVKHDDGRIRPTGLGATRDDFVDYGAEVLYGGYLPVEYLAWRDGAWTTIEVSYDLTIL